MTKPSQNKAQSPRTIFLVLSVLSLFVTTHLLRQCIKKDEIVEGTKTPQRIIALSPSTVEIIYQLEQEDHLVAVSRFCTYPPDVTNKPQVGGYLDLDFETLLKHQPDCVILLAVRVLSIQSILLETL